jgi:hypothetical protein
MEYKYWDDSEVTVMAANIHWMFTVSRVLFRVLSPYYLFHP